MSAYAYPVKEGDTLTRVDFLEKIAEGYEYYATPDGFVRRITDAIPLNPDCISVTWTRQGWKANMVKGWKPLETHVVVPGVVKDALVRIPPLEAAEETQIMVQIPLRLKTAFEKWLKAQK
jgi:hypothetical protein